MNFCPSPNGTLIDKEFCQKILRVKNFVPAISLEGFADTNDIRREESVYQKITHAMELLKLHKLPFAISVCYTSQNFEDVSSEAFYDKIIDMVALFVWFFHCMPIGNAASAKLILNPEQHIQRCTNVFRNFMEAQLSSL